MMEHCLTSKASVLLVEGVDSSDMIDAIKGLGGNLDVDDVKQQLKATMKAMDKFIVFVKCLLLLASEIPRQPLGKFVSTFILNYLGFLVSFWILQFHSVYTLALLEPIHTTQEYREVFKFLNLSEKTSIVKQLETIIECLKEGQEVDEAAHFLQEIKDLDTKVIQEPKVPPSPNLNKTLSGKGKLDRFKLQEALLEQVKGNKVISPFEALRAKIMAFYHRMFERALIPPRSLPLHENLLVQ